MLTYAQFVVESWSSVKQRFTKSKVRANRATSTKAAKLGVTTLRVGMVVSLESTKILAILI